MKRRGHGRWPPTWAGGAGRARPGAVVRVAAQPARLNEDACFFLEPPRRFRGVETPREVGE